MPRVPGKMGRQIKFYFGLIFAGGLLLALPAVWAQYPLQYPAESEVRKDGTAILIEDYATPPLSSQLMGQPYPPPIDYHAQLARIVSMRSEPADVPLASARFFVADMNGNLYILDKATKKFTPYITLVDIFPRYSTDRLTTGIQAIAFDPNYAKNGKFYTVHSEDPSKPGAVMPTNAHTPGLNLDGYAPTAVTKPPVGDYLNESVLVEWTDTNIKNSTFEGTAREILRVGFSTLIHPMDDVVFNPLAKPGSPDYENLYVSLGDGGSGETPGAIHVIPQSLNALPGKIIRITPNLALRPKDKLGENGRYRIPSSGPDPNPFLSVAGARPEILAFGFRNPHRMDWDAASNLLLVNDIGLHSWEEINIVTKGGNYGYGEREGNELMIVTSSGKTGTQVHPQIPFPETDLLTVDGMEKPVAPIYPVATYSHVEGDAIGSGFVYRGKLMPRMVGKYIFTDLTTGRIFYADLNEMIASHSLRGKQAPIHEIQVMYKSPYDQAAQNPVQRRMYDIVAETFAHKDGVANPDSPQGVLPGAATATGGWRGKTFLQGSVDPYGVPYGGGRADVRLSMGGDGEIYIMSKSDGMIRKMMAVVTPPPASSAMAAH